MAGKASDVFPINRLPPELRLLIWEATWPGPRVVEVADVHVPDSTTQTEEEQDEPSDILHDHLCLRPTSRLCRWLNEDFGHRIVEDGRLEDCEDPVALCVNHESRMHTLHRFIPIRHPDLKSAAFYFNPRTDILCLPVDVDREYLTDLRKLYGIQLDQVEMVLFDQCSCWHEPQLASGLLEFFRGVSVVQVLLEYKDDRAAPSEKDYVEASKALYERDAGAPDGRKWSVQYIDRQRNVYGELKA